MRSQLQRSLDAAVLDEVTHEHVERRAWEEEWLTTKQTTKALSISEPTLRGMRRRGEIRSIRVGQAYRYQLP